jgi:glutamate--cysteine ligase
LQEIVASGITPADKMLAAYHSTWAGDVTKAYGEYSY